MAPSSGIRSEGMQTGMMRRIHRWTPFGLLRTSTRKWVRFALLLLDQDATSERLPSLEGARRSQLDRVGVVQMAPTSETGSEGVQGWILRQLQLGALNHLWKSHGTYRLSNMLRILDLAILRTCPRIAPNGFLVEGFCPFGTTLGKFKKAPCTRTLV